ncbi:MAG: PQQ-binding-like beta-propeller repeat protein, partial [Aquificales bacterium]|nr:PQQ-binding-like beta-propeller repeat protein [Aquificales bacterium]
MKTKRGFSILFLVASLLIVLFPGASKASLLSEETSEPGLFTPVDTPMMFSDASEPTTIRYQPVTLNVDAVPDARTLTLNLFDDVTFSATQTGTETGTSGSQIWLGELDGVEGSSVTLVTLDNIMVGNIRTQTDLYQVNYVGGDIHAISEVDMLAFPPEVHLLDTPEYDRIPAQENDPDAVADDGSIVTVLVAYTAAARQAAGGTSAMIATVNLAVSETNQGYNNSSIAFDLQLVHTVEVNYAETGDYGKDLQRFRGTTDGYMNNVHNLRDSYKADMMSLITNSMTACGVGYVMGTPSTSFASSAFNVVKRSCATGYYSFAHELGHNMGSFHDRANSSGSPYYPYAYGYQAPNRAFRTIMAYNCGSGGCTRVNYWSNPNKYYGGQPMGKPGGDPNSADNHRSLNNNASIVANFRVSTVENEPPQKPTLVSPGNGVVLNSRTVGLSWQAGADDGLPNATPDYLVQIDNNSNFSSPEAQIGWGYTNTSWTTTLDDDGVYYWRVVQGDGALNSGWTTARSFQIDTSPAPCPGCGAADSAWPMYRHDLKHTGRSPYNGPDQPGKELEFWPSGSTSGSSAVIGEDNTVYVGLGHHLYALNPDHSERWTFDAGNSVNTPFISADGKIYFTTHEDSTLHALNLNGQELWTYDAGEWSVSAPVVDEYGIIYFGSADGYFYAIHPDGSLYWRYHVGTWINSSPALGDDGTIYFGASNRYVYALNSNGTLKWRYQTDDYVDCTPAIAPDGTIYIGTTDGYFYALRSNGTLKWRYLTGDAITGFTAPAIAVDGTVYIGSEDDYLYAFRPDGTLKWRFLAAGNVTSPVIGADGTVYAADYGGYLYAVNSSNGAMVWRELLRTNSWLTYGPAISSNKQIYVVGYDGRLFVVGEKEDTPLSVDWVAPVQNEAVHHVSGENVTLKVDAGGGSGVAKVRFLRWDATTLDTIYFAEDTTEPYQVNLDTSQLNLEWNYIAAQAVDTDGNVSPRKHIWLFRDHAGIIPRPPLDFEARSGLDAVLLSWKPSPTPDVAGYYVYRKTWGQTGVERLTLWPVSGLNYRDATAVSGTTYTYYATAIDSQSRESLPSNTKDGRIGQISLIIPEVHGTPGDMVDVPVQIENGDGLCIEALDVAIAYDASAATAVGVIRTPLTNEYTFTHDASQSGAVHISSIGNCSELYGPGNLFLVRFFVHENPTLESDLDFIEGLTGTVIYDEDDLSTPVEAWLIDGELIV